ncbi:MAG: DUF1109 family protein [Rickettsiales bacterium]|nr:DUF1109 family protein [Rickettsiales bacterium]
MNTEDLINNLVNETKPVKPLKKPSCWMLQFIIFSVIYYLITQYSLGVRSDITEKLSQAFFATEVFLMIALLLSCMLSMALMLYPDNYQKFNLTKLPYIILLFIFSLFGFEIFLQNEADLVVNSTHNIKCSICIAAFAIIPSFYFFYILRKGANIHPLKSGALAIIAASTIACIALRISEQNDLLSHLLFWHYLPVIIFSAIGAFIGKSTFRW